MSILNRTRNAKRLNCSKCGDLIEEDASLLKCIRVGSPTPPRWMTFYPRTVFFPPPSVSARRNSPGIREPFQGRVFA